MRLDQFILLAISSFLLGWGYGDLKDNKDPFMMTIAIVVTVPFGLLVWSGIDLWPILKIVISIFAAATGH
nr:hypothetical protein BdHM001_36060 [Bdellovibrio sp. HM001]